MDEVKLVISLKVIDSDGRAISSNPAIVYVYVKHNPNNSSQNNTGITTPSPQSNFPPTGFLPKSRITTT